MATKQQGDQGFNMDFTKFLSEYKVPGLDVEALVAAQRKNIEAVTQANQLAYEGLNAVSRRQMEIVRQTIEDAARVAKDIAEPGTPQDKASKQAELVKGAFEQALSHVRELSEMVVKSNTEAFELLNKRFSQSMDEWRDAISKGTGK